MCDCSDTLCDFDSTMCTVVSLCVTMVAFCVTVVALYVTVVALCMQEGSTGSDIGTDRAACVAQPGSGGWHDGMDIEPCVP